MAPRLAMQMTANASQWKSELLQASNAVKETSLAVQTAKESIRQNFLEQVSAAREVGASQEELRAITERCAQGMAAAEESGSTQITAALQRQRAAYEQTAAAKRALYEQSARNNAADVQRFTSWSAERGTSDGGRDNSAINNAIRMQWEERARQEAVAIQAAADSRDRSLQRVQNNQDAARKMFFRTAAQTEREGLREQLAAWKDAKLIDVETYERRLAELAGKVEKDVEVLSGHGSTNSGGGKHGITDMQAASALDRAVIDGKPGIRAAERFSLTIPGFDKFANAVFPYVGAAAFAAAIWEGEKALEKEIDEAREMPGVINAGFRAMHAAAESSTDALIRSTHEIENQQAALEHKPINNLAIEIDDARINADRLADSAQQATEKVNELLKANQVGAFAQVFMGKGSTGAVSDEIMSRFNKLRELRDANRDAVHSGNDTPAALDQRKKEYLKSEDDFNKWLIGQYNTRKDGKDLVPDYVNAKTGEVTMKSVSYAEAHGSQDENLAALRGAQQILFDQNNNEEWRSKQAQAQRNLKGAEDRKGMASAASEAARKVEKDQRDQWQSAHDWWAAEADRTLGEEAAFWLVRAGQAKEGSENYRDALHKASEAIQQEMKANVRLEKENQHLEYEIGREQEQQQKQQQDDELKRITDHSVALVAALRKQADARTAAQRSMEDKSIDSSLATGNLSKGDARDLRHQLEMERYQEDRAALENKLAFANSRENFGSDEEQRTASVSATSDIITRDAEHARAVMEYEAELAGEGWRAGLKRGIEGFVDDAADSARQVQQIFTGALGGFNQDLTQAFEKLGNRHEHHQGRDFRNALGGTLRNTSGQIFNAGLQKAEGGLFKALGLSKADGSRSNPFSVLVMNPGFGGAFGQGGGAVSPDLLSQIAAGFPGATTGAGQTSSTGSKVSGAFSLVAGLLTGARATGGPLYSGKWLVGENGPEVVDIGGSGYVTPNDRLPGGNSMQLHIPVDARGSGNPAEVEAAVHRGVMAAAPHIIQASLQAHKDVQSRTPMSKR